MSLEAIKIDLESKGWIVKSGSLYGGDFALYNPSPFHTHSEYILKFFESPPTYREILGSLRCSRSVKKVNPTQKLLIATSDLAYYHISND